MSIDFTHAYGGARYAASGGIADESFECSADKRGLGSGSRHEKEDVKGKSPHYKNLPFRWSHVLPLVAWFQAHKCPVEQQIVHDLQCSRDEEWQIDQRRPGK